MMTPYGNPYIAQLNPQQQQELGGLMPVFQNIGNQQAMQNAALAQQNQLVGQAGQTAQGGGMNPIAMAALLRKGNKPLDGTNLGARIDMALNSQASPYLQDQVAQLGSSTSNPFSDYNMGTGGWGNYGE